MASEKLTSGRWYSNIDFTNVLSKVEREKADSVTVFENLDEMSSRWGWKKHYEGGKKKIYNVLTFPYTPDSWNKDLLQTRINGSANFMIPNLPQVPPGTHQTAVYMSHVGGGNGSDPNHWATYAFNTRGEILVINSMGGTYNAWDEAAVAGMKEHLRRKLGINNPQVYYINPAHEGPSQRDGSICGGITLTAATAIDPDKSFAEQFSSLKAITTKECHADNYGTIRAEHESLRSGEKEFNNSFQHIYVPGTPAYNAIRSNAPAPAPKPPTHSEYGKIPLNSKMGSEKSAIFTESILDKLKAVLPKDYKFKNDKDNNLLLFKGDKPMFIADKNFIKARETLDEESCRTMIESARVLYGNTLVMYASNDLEQALMDKISKELNITAHITRTEKEFDDKQKELGRKKFEHKVDPKMEEAMKKPVANPDAPATEKLSKEIENLTNKLNFSDTKLSALKDIFEGKHPTLFTIEELTGGGKKIIPKNEEAKALMEKINEAIYDKADESIELNKDNSLNVPKTAVDTITNAKASELKKT